MDKVVEFKNGNQIEIIKTSDSSFRNKKCKPFMTQEDLGLLWYLNEVYVNENALS